MISEETIDKVGISLLETWRLCPEDIGRLLGYRDRAERLIYLLDIRRLLDGLFRDEAVENRWLREPLDHSTAATPLSMMLSKCTMELQVLDDYVRHISGL